MKWPWARDRFELLLIGLESGAQHRMPSMRFRTQLEAVGWIVQDRRRQNDDDPLTEWAIRCLCCGQVIQVPG